ncbi:MAG: MBOAT family protein [Clostridia bacterium]|nr:MBOAT family protein [Clostridia bacterium]
MLFTSYEFLAFLAGVLILYYVLPKKLQWPLLLCASYIFYALAGLKYLAFIGVTTLSVYATAVVMARMSGAEERYLEGVGATLSKDERKANKARAKRHRLFVLLLGVILNFGILAVLKYTAFAVVNINSALHSFGAERSFSIPSLVLPLGISFYTFQSMGYIIDVYRGKAKAERNLFKLALFISFFPQLVQGPISRFSSLGEQLTAERRFERRTFTYGVQRILWGYFKKLVIADRVLVAVNAVVETPEAFRGFYVFLLIILYSIQIYADFTGGIDITIGIAEALGIKLAENFKRPFSSRSTDEYWNRWHITMGTWFTDYVFYPLSVSRPMQSVSKKSRKWFGKEIGKRVPVYLATIITWFLTGLWHGAGWNFIVWGLLNCAVILISREFKPLYERFHKRFPTLAENRAYGAFMCTRTFLLMGLIRSLDCYRNVSLTFRMWGSMLTEWNIGEALGGGISALGLSLTDYIIVAIGCALMFSVSSLGKEKSIRERLYDRPALSWCVFGALFVLILLFGAYSIGYDASQFIYNQF